MLVIAYAVRRLLYALAAAPRCPSLASAWRKPPRYLGAGKFTTLTRIVVPLMTHCRRAS